MLGISELNIEMGAVAIAIEELCGDVVGLDNGVVPAPALRHSGGGMARPPDVAFGLAPR